jgi:glycosyltransferase involved in cell wall biosynthesis
MNNPIELDRENLSRSHETHPKDILFVARLHRRKRVELFLAAARLLIADERDIWFSVVGPDEGDLPLVLRACRDPAMKGRVKYEGSMTPQQSRRRISSSSVFVATAEAEPFGMTIAEAMIEGVPVVLTPGAALHLEWQKAGAALIVQPTAEDVAGGIDRILRDPSLRSRLTKAGRQWVESRCSPKEIADVVARVYTKVCQPHANHLDHSDSRPWEDD